MGQNILNWKDVLGAVKSSEPTNYVSLHEYVMQYRHVETYSRREMAIRAAAYIDTDGSIGIAKRGYTPRCTFTNTDSRIIYWLYGNFGGSVSGSWGRKKDGHKRRPIQTWTVLGTQAHQFLLIIHDHLMIKQRQADVAIHLAEFRHKHRGRLKSVWALEYLKEFHAAMKAINQNYRE